MTAIEFYLIATAAAIAVGLLRNRSKGTAGERDPQARPTRAWGKSDGTRGPRSGVARGIDQSPGNRRVDRPAA